MRKHLQTELDQVDQRNWLEEEKVIIRELKTNPTTPVP